MTRVPRLVRAVLLVALLAAAAVLFGRVGPSSVRNTYPIYLGFGVCYAAAALSLNLLMGYAGQISLGHFALLGIGAFTAGILTSAHRFGLPFAIALPTAAAAGAAVSFVIGLPALRLRGLQLAVVTIGFSYAMIESVFRYKSLTGGSSGIEVPRPLVGTYQFLREGDYLALLIVLLALLWLVDVNVTRSKLGRAFHAIRAGESVAQAYGINVARYKLLAFVISGAMAGVAGAMYGTLIGYVAGPSFEYQFSLLTVIIVVVGGLRSRPGVVIAGLVYGALPQMLSFFVGWDMIIGSALLMYAVARHPGGFAQVAAEIRQYLAHRRVQVEDEPPLPRLPDLPRPSGLPDRPALAEGEPLLSVRDVTVRFGGLTAVDGASFDVHRNRIVGLIGPNGAGKSTLFNAVSGLVPLSSGRITLLGHDVTNDPPHSRAAAGLGRTFQMIGLAKDRSVTENLLLAQHSVAGYSSVEALLRVGRSRRLEPELRERAEAALSALGFERYANTPVNELSHGQQRIVELGCVLVTAPELVLLDEPSAGMSPGAAENLAQRLRDIRDELGRTVLLIEHNIPLVLDLCDDLYVLEAGRVIASGPAHEVAALPEVVGAYLGEVPELVSAT